MAQDVIAIICDCDGTLCPDTSNYLVEKLGLKSKSFWRAANDRAKEGWDPPLSYLNKLIEECRQLKNVELNEEIFREVGRSVVFYPGALDFVQSLRKQLGQQEKYLKLM